MKYFFIISFLLLGVCESTAVTKKVMYDTASTITVKAPAPQSEKSVFSDKEFVYDKNVKESKNWLEAFWNWLMDKLFGQMSTAKARNTWYAVKYISIVLFVFGIVFILWKSKFRALFKPAVKKMGSSASFEDITGDINTIDMDVLIAVALQKENYRLAVRFQFLKVLQAMHKKNIIDWQPHKTNIDYQHELRSNSLQNGFSYLSKVFEYVWYGETKTGTELYHTYQDKTTSFINSMHA